MKVFYKSRPLTVKLSINPFSISKGRYQLDPGVPYYTPTPLVSEKVVCTILVVWNFGAPNATPALPSPLALGAPRGRATPRAQEWGPVAIGHVL